ncbi:hypothetical protein [Nocardioides jiangxiensis]|uniref:Uncharacterized protein n=1 Tax=Nocardioides jiangxiensis TaxID=3064524 RepID=A0ABT9B0X7_9ACTN|nr:hypothetical protein [Nocardioides sp. WY-20]MDO7868506.1 hypothetical protein [Nocardioides sp. WY-20]
MHLARVLLGATLVAVLGAVAPATAATAPVPVWGAPQKMSPDGVVVERVAVGSIEGQLVVARVQRPVAGSTCTLWLTRETATAAAPAAQQVAGDLASCEGRPVIGLSRNGAATITVDGRWSALRADDTWSPLRAAPTSSCGAENVRAVIGLSRSRTAVVSECPTPDLDSVRHLRERIYLDGVGAPSVRTLTPRPCAGWMDPLWDSSASGQVMLAWSCRYDPDVASHASTIDSARYVPGQGWRATKVVADGRGSRTWYRMQAVGVTPSGSSTVVFAPQYRTWLKARRASADGYFGSVYKIASTQPQPEPACPAYQASVQSSGRIDVALAYERVFSRPALNLPVDASETFTDRPLDCLTENDIRLDRTGLLWRVTKGDLIAVRWQGQLQWSAPQDVVPAGSFAYPAADAVESLGPDAHAYYRVGGVLYRRVGTLPGA